MTPVTNPAMIPAVSKWAFAARNAESSVAVYPVSYEDTPIVVTIFDAVSPFDLSSVDPAHTRKSLILRLSPDWEAQFECMEACLTQEIDKRRLLGAGIDTATGYKPICKKSGTYPAQLRVKINTTGAAKVRYWNAAKARMEAPLDHCGLTYTARIELRAVWASDDSYGLVALCTDLMQQNVAPVHCPF